MRFKDRKSAVRRLWAAFQELPLPSELASTGPRPGSKQAKVIDLLKHPQLARGDQIVAVPTLVRHLPPPMKKIIGDLSSEESVLVGLDLRPKQ